MAFASTLLTGCVAVNSAGEMVAHDRRTSGTIVEDNSIEHKSVEIVKALTPDIEKENVHINIVSYNGNVLLLGQVPNDSLRKKFATEIQSIPKVNALHNELTVGAPTPMLTRANDSLITTKVKSAMVANNAKVDAKKVKVVTEDGVVYLMGIIKKSEEDTAVDIARRTKGVKKVVKMFEHLPA